MNEEIIETLARKHDMPEEQIKLIIRSFYDGLRHHLSNPLESKSGVMIHGLMTFYINEGRMKKEIERLKLKTFSRKPQALENSIANNIAILQNTYKYERQTSKSRINKRYSSKTPEGERIQSTEQTD